MGEGGPVAWHISDARGGSVGRRGDDGEAVRSGFSGPARACWGSWWREIAWDGLPAGEYRLHVEGEAEPAPFTVASDLLWETSWRVVALDQLTRRAMMAGNTWGWQDCGFPLREANSHAACVIGLTDVLEFRRAGLSPDEIAQLEAHIETGCLYLAKIQDVARARHGEAAAGALVHGLETHEEHLLADDAAKAIVAWARAARLATGLDAARREDWARRAAEAWRWMERAGPPEPESFDPAPHGAAADFRPAPDWATYQLVLQAWAALELVELGREELADRVADLLARVAERQIIEPTEAGVHGHFRLFSCGGLTNKAWSHHLPKHRLGYDLGATFPDYLLPFLRALRRWPTHAQAPIWEGVLRRFAYGYFLPASRANPFGILPLGDFGAEGLLWFAGSWHGANSLYALSAALALEFARHFDDAAFVAVAEGNLQWIAGLNCGLTRRSLEFSLVFSTDVPPGRAVPVSMIFGVGRRWAGSYLNLRGSICNGFGAGQPFLFDVPPRREFDGPTAFTDEDWITHAGAWLSGVARLAKKP